MERIGLIAGSGQFPTIFSKVATERGLKVYAVAHEGETDPRLATLVEAVKWVKIGQLKKIIAFFKKNSVRDAVMAGAITKTKMFSGVRPDLMALKVLATMDHTQDDGLLRAFAGEMEKEGITIHPSTFLLPELLAKKGCWTRRKPTKSEMADVRFGWRIVREIGRLDIGQSVVVRGGSVMAVEAIDGTDATIRRGGRLGKEKTVVVKASKPDQDMRFDMPAVGLKTIQTMCEVGASVLAIEAGKTVVFDREEMVAMANQNGIAIVGIEE
ncbi:MAG: UDP-2,3-diacylglucosamine diphosphatase LpxI [Deltaproteobacteria bacterium]|nr:UDP-2,3-diacylglucosamine diphosphatase LpxI [Deltaproteobacteria bacterium]